MNLNSKNKRLAKNTIYLYIRMLFAVCINLYTSRLVLEYLGVEDFGVYNIVGGIVALMMFVNTSMRGATSRFITFSLGRNNLEDLKNTVSSSIQVHALIALLLLLAGETFGLWFVNNELNIPETTMDAANWVYQFSLLTSVVAIFQVPFNACVMSYEKMDVFAIIEIINVVLKCIMVFSLVWFPDRLIAYGGLLFAVSVLVCLMYFLYCLKKLDGFYFTFQYHKDIVRPMIIFAACDLFGNGTFAVRQQGINILINKFFGVSLNAAGGVATQASGIISTFMNNVLSAFRPQIIKEYSVGNISRMSKLMNSECEILILMVGLIFVPLFLNMDFIMQIWLKNVPPYAATFCKILLIFNAISIVTKIVQDGLHATGKIKKFSLFAGSINLLCVFIAYIFFLFGLDAQYAYYSMIICVVLQTFINSFILGTTVEDLDMRGYLLNTIKPILIVLLSLLLIDYSVSSIREQWIKLLFSTVLNIIFICIAVSVFYSQYRDAVIDAIRKKSKNKNHM